MTGYAVASSNTQKDRKMKGLVGLASFRFISSLHIDMTANIVNSCLLFEAISFSGHARRFVYKNRPTSNIQFQFPIYSQEKQDSIEKEEIVKIFPYIRCDINMKTIDKIRMKQD